MPPALRPLYCLPIGDHCALTLRLPCGGSIDLLLFDGGGCARSVALWRLAGRCVLAVCAGDG